MIKLISSFIISLLAYFISGKLGLYLAIPPGFASAVWPASGVALACILLLDTTGAALGVAAGSFLLNLGLTSQGYENISWQSILPAMMISSGALLQGVGGWMLFKRMIGFPTLIDSPKEIIRFAFFITPLSCIIAASIGVSTLYLNGLIAETNLAFSWLTWWAGDTIGVLLFTPIVLMLFSQNKHLVKSRKLQTILPTIIIFSGVLVLFFGSTESRHKTIANDINDSVTLILRKIEERLNISNSKLTSYTAFFQSSDNVSQDEFDTFSRVILKDDTVFQAISWTEIVPQDKRKQYESIIRKNGYPGFSFTEIQTDGSVKPAPQRDVYYPVLYIYPLQGNVPAFGLNLAANPHRLEALKKSRENAKPYATAPIILAQEKDKKFAYILYVPVFNNDDKQYNDFKGYIGGVFKTSGLFGDIINGAKKSNYSINITDITELDTPFILTTSEESALEQFSPISRIFDFGGRKIEVAIYANSNYNIATKDWASWTILTGGFLIVALLQSFILMITGNTENTKREVNRKTKDLYEAKKIAEDASKAKLDFTANMSHEIRTPLNAIIGLINLCLKTQLTNQQNDYLKKAKLASNTLLSLINQVLDYSKIESGMLEIEYGNVELSEILKKIHAIFSTQADQKGLKFILQIPSTIPDLLAGDPLRLEQILLNLCSNALKFTTVGSIQLIMNIKPLKDNKVMLDFTIADTGIGVPEDQQQYLFESYKQADSSTSRKFGGSGLGLTITKQLVELMGGSVSMSSEENKGSMFYIHLTMSLTPQTRFIDSSSIRASFQPSEDINSSLAAQQLPHSPDESDKLKNVSILLAEDVLVNQLIAKAVLQGYGANVITAANGLEVLKKLEETSNIDIILMDIQMPEMDGYDATKKIREDSRYQNLPIIAMTANAMSSDIEQCRIAGMNDHVAKPFEEVDLVNKILKQLAKQQTN